MHDVNTFKLLLIHVNIVTHHMLYTYSFFANRKEHFTQNHRYRRLKSMQRLVMPVVLVPRLLVLVSSMLPHLSALYSSLWFILQRVSLLFIYSQSHIAFHLSGASSLLGDAPNALAIQTKDKGNSYRFIVKRPLSFLM